MVSMAALKLLLSEARRHCLARRHSHHHISPFLGFYRSLCSSSSSPSESDPIPPTATESPRRPSGTVPIQPISYAPKPKEQSSPDQDRAEETPRTPSPQKPRIPPESLRSPSHETRPARTSESNPIPPTATESPGRPSGTVPIQPVSYGLKPKDQSSPDQDPAEEAPTTPSPQQLGSPSHETRPAWTREEMRYVKDAPSISPVSYQSRVAPLPEDKASAGIDSARREGEGVREKRTKQNDAEIRMRRRVFKVVEEEKVAAPFPTLIKIEKKERKPILDLTEAIRQVKASAKCNFDETVEAHVRLGIPPKKAGQGVRGNMTLPHGTGKVVRVAFFAEGAHAEEARAAGVDIVGGVELVEQIASSKKLNVDKCFATNEMILRMGKISRILRERGLWPDRRLGTVTNDVSEALKKVSKGHIEFRMDKTSNVHVGLGKVSYAEDNLRENVGAFVNALLHAKPAGLKKASKYAGYISSFHVCSTMGPGFSVSVQSLSKAADQYNKVYLK